MIKGSTFHQKIHSCTPPGLSKSVKMGKYMRGKKYCNSIKLGIKM